MARQKYDDLLKSPKYRCYFGNIHIQTLTKILCVFLLLISAKGAYIYVGNIPYNGNDQWVFFKISAGFVSLAAPLIGIQTKDSSYFYVYFFPTGVRVLYYFYILFSICVDLENIPYKEEFKDLISDEDMGDIRTLIPNFTSMTLLFLVVSILLIKEVLVFYVIYICYKYIEALSVQSGEYGYQAKKHGKSKRNYSKEITKDAKPLINLLEAIKKYTGYSFIESIFVKKTTTSSKTVKAQPKSKTTSVYTNMEHKVEALKPKEPEIIQQTKITATNAKPVECNLEVNLQRNFVQKETTNIIVKLESTHVIQKTVKKTAPKKSSPTSASKSYLQQTFISNSLKPKKFVSIEIQTNETSFNQRIVKNRFKNFDYDSYSYLISPKTPSIINDENITDEKSPITSSSGFASTSDFSPFESVSPNSEANVTFLFKNDETCAVEISQNGKKEKVKNLFDNEWTPLYFSMAQKTPEIGEKAQIHFHHFREYILYDIFKILGKPLNEIEINPEWKFKIVEKNGIKYFQIKTQNGLNLFPENIILATFLKSMKGFSENYLNSEICEINVSSNFEISESQKSVFKNAASKIHLKILSFRVNDFE